ncbi:MAG TPA: hypothetical protein VGU74_15750, partial [Gemmatimonadales bacterium]|nr:hypothetical protein [Gemmatimonadales bacterium]
GYILAGVQGTTTPGDQPKPVLGSQLPALANPVDSTAAITLLFNERARWLWGTSHRLNDLRRLERAAGVRGGFGRPDTLVFPHGPYFKNGLIYGTDTNYPIPLDEQNNPGVQACLDRLP